MDKTKTIKYKYICEYCDYKTNKRANYVRHNSSSKHNEKIDNLNSKNQINNNNNVVNGNKNNVTSGNTNKIRCANDSADILNNKNIIHGDDNNVATGNNNNIAIDNVFENTKNIIQGSQNINTINITRNSKNINNINNYVINSPINLSFFGEDGIDMLTSEELYNLLSGSGLIQNLIKLVNFNRARPNHHNIYYPSKSHIEVVIFGRNGWQWEPVNSVMGTLIDSKIKDLQKFLLNNPLLSETIKNKIKQEIEWLAINKQKDRKKFIQYLRALIYSDRMMVKETILRIKQQILLAQKNMLENKVSNNNASSNDSFEYLNDDEEINKYFLESNSESDNIYCAKHKKYNNGNNNSKINVLKSDDSESNDSPNYKKPSKKINTYVLKSNESESIEASDNKKPSKKSKQYTKDSDDSGSIEMTNKKISSKKLHIKKSKNISDKNI